MAKPGIVVSPTTVVLLLISVTESADAKAVVNTNTAPRAHNLEQTFIVPPEFPRLSGVLLHYVATASCIDRLLPFSRSLGLVVRATILQAIAVISDAACLPNGILCDSVS